MGVCDVCNREIEEPEGYLLTTREVVTSTRYWSAYLGLLLTKHPASQIQNRLLVVVGRMASSDTPWMVCQNCGEFFSFDHGERRAKARAWRATGQPEGGFSLCSIDQRGSDFLVHSKDDDAMMIANLAAAAVLAGHQGEKEQATVMLAGWIRRVEQLSGKKDLKNVEDRIT